jgi:hypothetical protein
MKATPLSTIREEDSIILTEEDEEAAVATAEEEEAGPQGHLTVSCVTKMPVTLCEIANTAKWPRNRKKETKRHNPVKPQSMSSKIPIAKW